MLLASSAFVTITARNLQCSVLLLKSSHQDPKIPSLFLFFTAKPKHQSANKMLFLIHKKTNNSNLDKMSSNIVL